MLGVCPSGFPHSDISGSLPDCGSPKLFAAFYVLRRLLVPRHSPNALSYLTFVSFYRSVSSDRLFTLVGRRTAVYWSCYIVFNVR